MMLSRTTAFFVERMDSAARGAASIRLPVMRRFSCTSGYCFLRPALTEMAGLM